MRLLLLCVALLGPVGSAGATTYYLLKDGGPYSFKRSQEDAVRASGLRRTVEIPLPEARDALNLPAQLVDWDHFFDDDGGSSTTPTPSKQQKVKDYLRHGLHHGDADVQGFMAPITNSLGPDAPANLADKMNHLFSGREESWVSPAVWRLKGLEGVSEEEHALWAKRPQFSTSLFSDKLSNKGRPSLNSADLPAEMLCFYHTLRHEAGVPPCESLASLGPESLVQPLSSLDALFLSPVFSASVGCSERSNLAFFSGRSVGGFLLGVPSRHLIACALEETLTFVRRDFFHADGWRNVVCALGRGLKKTEEVVSYRDLASGEFHNELLITPVLGEGTVKDTKASFSSISINAVFVKIDPKRDDVDWKSPETWPADYKKYWDLANTPTQNCPWNCYKQDCTEHRSSLPLVLIDESNTLSAT